MPINQNLNAYQKSVSDELRATQNRVRHLIGSSHWLTDGEHKEAVLRNVLRTRLPESLHIGKGFVCFPVTTAANEHKRSSRQLDILITAKAKPTLYKDGELVFVTADAVEAVVEVKTTLRATRRTSTANHNERESLQTVLTKLAGEVQLIRQNAEQKTCWAGLFVFEQGNIKHEDLLTALQIAAEASEQRVINCVTIGRNTFARFWSRGESQVRSPIEAAVWHSYELENLAPAYFISNLAVELSPDIPPAARYAWFPVEGGKETLRHCYVPLLEGAVEEFHQEHLIRQMRSRKRRKRENLENGEQA